MGSGSTSEQAVHQPRRIGDADVMGRRPPKMGLVITDSIDDTATPDVPDHRSRIGKRTRCVLAVRRMLRHELCDGRI